MSIFEEDVGRKQVGSEGNSDDGLVIIFWQEMANLGEHDNRVKKCVTPQTAQNACSWGGGKKSTKGGNSSQFGYSLSVSEKQNGKVDDYTAIIY